MGRQEKCHQIPKYLGGTTDPSNIVEAPLPLHAFQHKLIADSLPEGNDKDANLWAVKKIVQRMSFEEVNEYFRLKEIDERDKKK